MNQQDQKGQTIVEVVLAAGVILMSLSVMVAAVVSALANNRAAKERAIATRLGQEAVEWARQERDEANWTGFTNAFTVDGRYCLDVLPDISGNVLPVQDMGGGCPTLTQSNTTYTRVIETQLTTGLPGSDEFDATVIVEWSDGGDTRSVELVTQLREI